MSRHVDPWRRPRAPGWRVALTVLALTWWCAATVQAQGLDLEPLRLLQDRQRAYVFNHSAGWQIRRIGSQGCNCKSGAGAAQQQCSQGDGDLFGVVLDKAGCKGKRIFSGLYQAVFQNLDSMV